MSMLVAALVFVVLLAISMAHLMWSFGLTYPIRDEKLLAQTVVGKAGIKHMPSRWASFGISMLTLASGILALALADHTSGGTSLSLLALPTAAVFLARGAVGYTQWWARLTPEPNFRVNDQRVYSPMSLFIGAGFLLLVHPEAAMKSLNGPLRVGIGGPVGSGKTTLCEMLLKAMRDRYSMAVVTNDIYTREDALILARVQAIGEDRIVGVETGGCPHTAIREDASLNLAAIDDLNRKFPDLDIILIESGGDNLAATFSPDLADITLYVISVAQGEKIPRKGGPAISRSDLLIITHTDLAPYVGASLEIMEKDTQTVRQGRPYVFTDMLRRENLDQIIEFIEKYGGMREPQAAE